MIILSVIIKNDCLSDVALLLVLLIKMLGVVLIFHFIINNLDNSDDSLNQDNAESSDDDISYHQSVSINNESS